MTGHTWGSARHNAPGTISHEKEQNWTLTHNGILLACSEIALVFLFCFPTLTQVICFGLRVMSAVTGKFISFSVLVWLICFVRDQKEGLLLFGWWIDWFLFYIYFDPFIFTVHSYRRSKGGMLAGGLIITEWKTTSKNCRLEKRIELPYSIQLTNFVQ